MPIPTLTAGINNPPVLYYNISTGRYYSDMVSLDYGGNTYNNGVGLGHHIIWTVNTTSIEISSNNQEVYNELLAPPNIGIDGSENLDGLLIDASVIAPGVHLLVITAKSRTAVVISQGIALGFVLDLQVDDLYLADGVGEDYIWNLQEVSSLAEHIRKNQYIGIGKEVTPATEVAPTIFFPFTGDLGAQVKKAWLTRDDEAFGIVDAYPPDGGRITLDDIPLNFKLNPEHGVYPFLAFIGQVSSAQQGSTIAYKHTFTTSAQDALPTSFTFEVYDTVDYYRLSEMRLKNISFALTADGHIMVNTSWVGRIIRKIAVGESTAPSYSTIRLYKFDDIYIYLGDRQTFANQALYDRIESLDLAIDRGIEGVNTFNQLAYTTKFASTTGRSSTGNNFVQRYQDATMRDLFWSNSTQPDSGAEYKSLELKCVGDQIAATGFYYTTRLLFPLIMISDHAVSGDSLIETVSFDAKYDPLAAYFVQGEITNTMTSV